MTYTELKDFVKRYPKSFKRANLTADTLYDIQEFLTRGTLEVMVNRYEKQGRKTFPKKPTETTVEKIPFEHYLNYISSIGFFGDYVEKTYTYCGYICTRLVAKSPDGQEKVERIFNFSK